MFCSSCILDFLPRLEGGYGGGSQIQRLHWGFVTVSSYADLDPSGIIVWRIHEIDYNILIFFKKDYCVNWFIPFDFSKYVFINMKIFGSLYLENPDEAGVAFGRFVGITDRRWADITPSGLHAPLMFELQRLYDSPAHDAVQACKCAVQRQGPGDGGAASLALAGRGGGARVDRHTRHWAATRFTQMSPDMFGIRWCDSRSIISYYIHFLPSSCGRWVLATYCYIYIYTYIYVWLGLFVSSLRCSHCFFSRSGRHSLLSCAGQQPRAEIQRFG